jgi:hypothetical protein
MKIKFDRKKIQKKKSQKNSILKFMSSKTNKIKRIEPNMIYENS